MDPIGTGGFQQYAFELEGVPLLLVSREAPAIAARRGTLLFIPGLGAAKETNLNELRQFAGAGFLAIGLDAVGHGERRYRDFEQRFAEGSPQRDRQLIETVVATAQELPRLVQRLEQGGLASGGVGLCGVSMGGFVAYAAAPLGFLDATVSLIASPSWRVDVPEDPMKNLERFAPTAVLSLVAGADELVDPEEARVFHRELERRYVATPDRQALVEYPQSGHFMREEDWEDAIRRAVQWFERFVGERRRAALSG